MRKMLNLYWLVRSAFLIFVEPFGVIYHEHLQTYH
jgi:hypothetical protein